VIEEALQIAAQNSSDPISLIILLLDERSSGRPQTVADIGLDQAIKRYLSRATFCAFFVP
jgi:hypothetical protein